MDYGTGGVGISCILYDAVGRAREVDNSNARQNYEKSYPRDDQCIAHGDILAKRNAAAR
jgi:hypothetical protein